MTMMAHSLWTKTSLVTLALGASLLAGCKHLPTDPSHEESSASRACAAKEANIADADDNTNQTFVIANRGGYWYTFVDKAGSDIWPTAGAKGGTFEMSPGGADGSPYAARMKGKIAVAEGYPGAGMGLNFVDPKGGYDGSKYKGISFFAKASEASVKTIRLKMPDENTDPDGGVCSECFNDFGMDLTLTTEWQKFYIPFNKLTQMKGWGKPRKFAIDTQRMYGIQFQVDVQGAEFDITVDQIRFTGCDG
jgi:endoglucanase